MIEDTIIPKKILNIVIRFEFYLQCIQYNVSHGKLNRGLMVSQTFKLLTEPVQHTEENIKRAIILGWCVEFVSRLT